MKTTTDIWFSAFLRLKGIALAKYEVIAKNKVKCFFNLTDEEWQKFRVEFNNSELSSYKTLIEQIKDLAY